jgi:hypothetical protein
MKNELKKKRIQQKTRYYYLLALITPFMTFQNDDFIIMLSGS